MVKCKLGEGEWGSGTKSTVFQKCGRHGPLVPLVSTSLCNVMSDELCLLS